MERATPEALANGRDEGRIGLRLREARRAAGMTLRQTAQDLGISAATWSAVENGRTRISEPRLAAAAALFGADLHRLRAPRQLVDQEPGWREFPPLQLSPPLAAALDAFIELGYHGASIRDIAQRAGLSVPGLYHHWPTKQHLLVALLDMTMDDLGSRARSARAEGSDPVERFSRLVECLALYHTHRRELGFIGASEMRSVDEPDRARVAALRTDVQRMVDEEVAAGCSSGLMATEMPRETARAIVTMCTALPQWWSPTGRSSPETVAGQYVQMARDLVRIAR